MTHSWKKIEAISDILKGDIVVKTTITTDVFSTPTSSDEFYRIAEVLKDEVILNWINYNEISETMKFIKIQTTVMLTKLLNGNWHKKN